MPLAQKIETVAKEIYGADGVVFTGAAQKQLKNLQAQGFGDLPVCIAKTQYSLSDDPACPNVPLPAALTSERTERSQDFSDETETLT